MVQVTFRRRDTTGAIRKRGQQLKDEDWVELTMTSRVRARCCGVLCCVVLCYCSLPIHLTTPPHAFSYTYLQDHLYQGLFATTGTPAALAVDPLHYLGELVPEQKKDEIRCVV